MYNQTERELIFMFRPEHPNPQFLREKWINLNGEWEFEFDFGLSGCDRKFFERTSLDKKINVPFCPESKLSGIEYKDFLNGVWYLKRFEVPNDWNGRVWLHFGASDYYSHVYVNTLPVGTHTGGYTPFKFDITEFLIPGENIITLYAEDDNRSGKQPKGKQANKFYSSGCDYTRTTGIWQTVWLEHTPQNYIKDFRFYPDPDNCKLAFSANTEGCGIITVKASYEGRTVGECEMYSSGTAKGEIGLSEKQLWEPGFGRLYDVEISFGEDIVKSYFGLRSIRIDGKRVLINGKSVFQRLVLDQGFYPDGIYTAPTDDDLKNDILFSMALGFNGARLHEKVFEPRFLYHCDKLGYLVWGEYPNWGIDYSNPEMLGIYLSQWHEAVMRDFNHPSIIGWCPFNETWNYNNKSQWDMLLSSIYDMTKSWDETRPCIDTSGNYHVKTDIYDVHDYTQNPAEMREHFNDGKVFEGANPSVPARQSYFDKKFFGKPLFVSEFGGIRWDCGIETPGWGYGEMPKSEAEFIERYKGLADALLDNENMFGFCYTQLYDIEQEINGLYTYSRKPKFDTEIFRKINSRKAKSED